MQINIKTCLAPNKCLDIVLNKECQDIRSSLREENRACHSFVLILATNILLPKVLKGLASPSLSCYLSAKNILLPKRTAIS